MKHSRRRTTIARLFAPLALLGLLVAACSPSSGNRPRPSVTESWPEQPPPPLYTGSFAEAEETGVARLLFLYVPARGFAYRDADGRLTGVTVELLRDFAGWVAENHRIAVEVSWIEEPRWSDFYAQVRDARGGVFGIGNVTITESRRDELAFSPPYLRNIAVLVTHTDVPELQDMDEIPARFARLTAASFAGTLHAQRLQAIGERWLPNLRTRDVGSNDELVERIAGGGHFGYMDAYNYWRAIQAEQPLRRHAVGDDASETFGVILPRGSDWAPVIESFFHDGGGYADSQRFKGHLAEHLGEELAAMLGAP